MTAPNGFSSDEIAQLHSTAHPLATLLVARGLAAFIWLGIHLRHVSRDVDRVLREFHAGRMDVVRRNTPDRKARR